MKYKVMPTKNELVMRDEDFIVSKTDTQGRITYANRIFMEFAGYVEAELLNKQHNIIRHPDMPRGVFKLLWDTIKSGKEIFAYVKNMTKDGSFYWTYANITPVQDENGQLIGYFSVRRKPRREGILIMEKLYKEMLEIEKKSSVKDAPSKSAEYLMKYFERENTNYEEFVYSIQLSKKAS